jgi:hypothetical protein
MQSGRGNLMIFAPLSQGNSFIHCLGGTLNSDYGIILHVVPGQRPGIQADDRDTILQSMSNFT